MIANRSGFAWVLLLAVFLIPASALAQSMEKIKIVYASRGLPFFSAFVAKEMNFYAKQGL
jgi:ABC-type nitrate/sulfonate/bicarbonate transport system substrate-binding protein